MPLPRYTLDVLFSGSDKSSRATIEGPGPTVPSTANRGDSNACFQLLTGRGAIAPSLFPRGRVDVKVETGVYVCVCVDSSIQERTHKPLN